MELELKPMIDEETGEIKTAPANELESRWINLADASLGAEALSANDEFFAAKERMLMTSRPVFIPGKNDAHGKWMDGWETRRRRGPGYDHCIIRLAAPGILKGFDLDTSHFSGNFAPVASIDACLCDGDPPDDAVWSEILPAVGLTGDDHNVVAIDHDNVWSHLRLNLYPDGGLARLRAYGQVVPDWSRVGANDAIDLAAVLNGGRLIDCSNQHYGSPLNILYPGIGAHMGAGWETHRRREPGFEWAIFSLGCPGLVQRIEVDTTHFKGNYPDRFSLHAANVSEGSDRSITTQSIFWKTLMTEQKLQRDQLHIFENEISDLGPVSHVRFNLVPDGGVNRLRILGRPA
jgi:allantoicase